MSSNCANFASQALEAGGWTYQVGQQHGAADAYAWSPKSTDGRKQTPTRTWSLAHSLYAYMKIDGPYHNLDTGLAQPGDLIFTDWDSVGAIDHVMVVTGKDKLTKGTIKPPTVAYTPRISQKSRNRHNIPLYETVSAAEKQGFDLKAIKWYALTTR